MHGATKTHANSRDDPQRRVTVEGGHSDGAQRPQEIGRYRIDGELGRGGVGVVYRAWDPQLERSVALKTLIAGRDASDMQVERFLREVRASAHLRHPSIVAVHDAGEIDRRFYLAMELIDGEPLDGHMKSKELSPHEAVELVVQIARALDYAHGEGFVHRDVKPENVLVDTRGHAYLTDFGLALDLGEVTRLTRTNQSLGTPAFMAPEQLRGHVTDPRVDIYSLGATLYELLTGQVPFPSDSFAELMDQVRSTDPTPPRRLAPRIAPDLEAIVLKCLEKDPEDRYPTAAALADDLDRFLSGEAVLATGPGPLRLLSRRLHRHRALVFGGAVAALGLLGGLATSWSVELDAAAAWRQKARLEQERRRLLDARREAVRRFELEESKRLAFAEASLAATTEEQVAAYDRFLEAYPKEWSGRVARARLLRILCHELRVRGQRVDEGRRAALRALEDLDQAVAISARPAPILLLEAELLRTDLKDAQGAMAIYEELAAVPPEQLGRQSGDLPRYARARLAMLAGHCAQAERIVREVLEARPSLAPARLLLSELHLAAGRAGDALEQLDVLAGNSNSEAEVARLRGSALLDLENIEGARRDALRAVELDPQEAKAHLLLGRVRLASGRPGPASACLERSLRIDPNQPDALVLQARATLEAWGDLPKAIQLVSAARAKGALDPELLGAVRQLALAKAAAGGISLDAEVRAILGASPPRPRPSTSMRPGDRGDRGLRDLPSPGRSRSAR